MHPAWLSSQGDRHDSPKNLAGKVENLIHPQAEQLATFGDVNADVDDPLGHAEQGDSRNHRHQDAVDRRMGHQPPLPAEGLATSGTFLAGHPVALEAKIADEVTHRQQQEEIEGGGEVDQARPRSAFHTLNNGAVHSGAK